MPGMERYAVYHWEQRGAAFGERGALMLLYQNAGEVIKNYSVCDTYAFSGERELTGTSWGNSFSVDDVE